MFFQGKKRLRPISGLHVATAYLAKTSVKARDVGHSSWEACSPEHTRGRSMRTFHEMPELWLILLISIINVSPGFPMQGSSNVLFSAICGAVHSDFWLWEHNAQHGMFEPICYEDNWRYKAIDFWVFKISIMKTSFSIVSEPVKIWHGCGSKALVLVIVLRCLGGGNAGCSLWKETFGYPQVADDGGCD